MNLWLRPCQEGGGKITAQVVFTRVSLEPRKTQRCAFVAFPEYGPATKCYVYWKYTVNRKSKMAA